MKRAVPIVIAAVAVVACAERSSSVAPGQKIPFTSVATARQLMDAIIIPTADVVMAAAHQVPENDAGWLNAERNAIALAESGNLLMLPGRMPATQASQDVENQEWVQQSVALTEAATLAVTAAGAHNAAKLVEAGDAIYAVCESCHQRFKSRP